MYDGVKAVRRSWNPGKGMVAELRYCSEGGAEEPGVVMWMADGERCALQEQMITWT